MPTVDYLPFATGGSADVTSQADWVAASSGGGYVQDGFSVGIAQPAEANKAWRQSTMVAAALATYVSQQLSSDVLDDGNLSALVTKIGNAIAAQVGALGIIQPGTILDYAGSTAPTGYLLCFGQTVSRTTYAALNTILSAAGYPYGSGDGSTTFGIPDLRGRVGVGKDDMGGTPAGRMTNGGAGIVGTTLGSGGGVETFTLTATQIPSHTHTATVTDPGHNHTGNTGPQSADHTHGIINGGFLTQPGTGGTIATTAGSSVIAVAASNGTSNDHSHAIASGITGVTVSNASIGGGAAHSNTQPSMILNKIIKT